MALDAICGIPQRSLQFSGGHGGIRNGLPQIADFERDFETLQLTENEESDPMHIPRPPFVSNVHIYRYIYKGFPL